MLIFIYDEFRRNYFGLYSKRPYEWRYEYIFWFITYISIFIIYNPFFPITMSSRDTWRFLDIMSALLIIFSLMRDIIIGVDLVFKYFQYKESIERYGADIPRRKLFICKEYGCGLGTGYRYLPSIECSLEDKESLTSWTNDEKLIFNVNDSDLWDDSVGIKRH